MTELGNKLRSLREDRGLTRRELAKMLSVTTPAVNHLESGIRLPSFEMLVKLSNVFGISSDELTRMSTVEETEVEVA